MRTLHQRPADFHGQQHAANGRDKINPARRPYAARQRGDHGARRVDAHAGIGRFKRDEKRNQRAGQQAGITGELRRVNRQQYDQHQAAGDEQFRRKRRRHPRRAGHGHDVIDCRVGKPAAQQRPRD